MECTKKWQETCKKLINLETLENEFVQYYGETHRKEIHDKLQNTTFAFAINDLDGFINLNNSFYASKVFKIPSKPDLYKDCEILINVLETNLNELINYKQNIKNLGYDANDIINSLPNGRLYKELKSNLLKVKKMILDNPTTDLIAYKNTKEEFKDLLEKPQDNISYLSIKDYIKNSVYFKDLITYQKSFDDLKNRNKSEYLNKFNNAFNTSFISFRELRNNKKFYQIALVIDKMRYRYLEKLNEIKADNGLIYTPNNLSDKQKNNISKISIKHLNSKTCGLEWTYRKNLLKTSKEQLKYNVLINLFDLTSYSAIIHELTHVMQTEPIDNPLFEVSGFQSTGISNPFNEVVTDFLAQRMTKKVTSDRHLPVNKCSKTAYSYAFSIMEDFLLTNEELLKECQFAKNSPKMLIEHIDFNNYKKLVLLTRTFLNLDPEKIINKICRKTHRYYKTAKDLIKDIDRLKDEYKNNNKIRKFLKATQDLYSLCQGLGRNCSYGLNDNN